MNYLISLIAANPKVYLELQEEFYVTRNADILIATISQALWHWEMSNKHVASAALERNELLQAIWQGEDSDIPPEYCVWLDEASVNDKTKQRQNRWSPVRQACVCQETFIHGQHYSVLPALTSKGIIALNIFEGAVNKERFIQFINEQVVSCPISSNVNMSWLRLVILMEAPWLNPYPAPWSVVIMDNCGIHHDEDIQQVIEDECGVCYFRM